MCGIAGLAGLGVGAVLFVWAVGALLGHDEPIWKEDVFEVFVAPQGLTPYFEIEVNPLGTTFDARIDSPDGERATMTTPRRSRRELTIRGNSPGPARANAPIG